VPPVDPDDFAERDLARIYIAATMAEARLVEAAFEARAIRYLVHADPMGRTLFGSPRHLAVFYVLAEEASVSEQVLIESGLEAGVVRE
jgi:hypothetical protein